jgi:hypothetical protein
MQYQIKEKDHKQVCTEYRYVLDAGVGRARLGVDVVHAAACGGCDAPRGAGGGVPGRRARARQAQGARAPPLEYLPRGILESEALEPYLKRWKRDNAAAAAAVAAAPTRAHCAYPLMD